MGGLDVTSVVGWDGNLNKYIILAESAQYSHETVPVVLRDMKEVRLLTTPMVHTIKAPTDFISDISAIA